MTYILVSKSLLFIVTLYNVILNAVKNLAASTNIQRLANLEILRSAQDDNVGCKHALYVILNAVKNLSERIDVGAIVDGRAIPEILRFAQDDNVSCKLTIIKPTTLATKK